jgi:hypothetical protein
MTSEPFLKPRFTGARFDGGAIPLEVLADFAALSEMILEVAKWRYREDHPKRKRVPRGFNDGVFLTLTGLEKGSEIPVISLVISTTTTLFPPEAQTYFEEARLAVVSAVGAAEHNRTITEFLPPKLLGYFDRFGRNLAEGEAIEFADEKLKRTVRLTKATRRKLILASSADVLTEETSVHGVVHEFDQRTRTFQITRPDESVLRDLPAKGPHYDTVLEASNGFRDKVHVRVHGVGRFDRHNRLESMEEVESVVILDPLDVKVRIDELKQLRGGWLDGKGIPPKHDGLNWLGDSFETYFTGDVPFPYLFPTPEGRILAEWDCKPWSPSLEIDLSIKNAEWHALNIETDHEEEKRLDLSLPEDWSWLAERIRALAGEIE